MRKTTRLGMSLGQPLTLSVIFVIVSCFLDYQEQDMKAGFFFVASAVMYAAHWIGERIND
jgi:hypothetical protein